MTPRLCLFVALLVAGVLFSRECLADRSDDKFVVALILPLSGELADYGAALRHGFEMAQEDFPQRFKHIELRYQDSRYDQKTSLSAFRFFEQQGDVDLYHTWGVSPNDTILPIANKAGRPVLAETSMRSAATGRPFVVRAARTGYDAAQRLIEAFVKQGWRRVGLLATQIPYYTDIVAALRELGPKHGISIDVLSEVSTQEHDFKTILVSAKAKRYQAFGSLLLLNQLQAFCEQANVLRFDQPMFGAHIHNSIAELKGCLPLSEGAIFPGQLVSDSFRSRYVRRYGTDQRLDAAADSYETASMIGELFGNEGSVHLTPMQIVERFRTIDKTHSSVGAYRFIETEIGGKSIAFNEVILTYRSGTVSAF